ncbi:response regulator [Flavobacterium hauense]
MKRDGQIIVIEDDEDDREIFTEVFDSLNYGNEIVYFKDYVGVIDYLLRPDITPFMIISDVNMPMMNGFQLRDEIYHHPLLKEKCVPYIFFTTAGSKETVVSAYRNSAQGLFTKPYDYEKFFGKIKLIVDYWKEALTPNSSF